MMISKFDTTGIEDNVLAFENRYRISLPEQYRKFLLKYNGGITPETEFKCKRTTSDIRAFYGVGENINYYSFENVFEIVLRDILPLSSFIEKSILPIAEDSWGNYITIGIDGVNKGNVFFCDHEKGMKTKLLTETFYDFIQKCNSAEFNSSDVLSPEEWEKKMIADGKQAFITDFTRSMVKETYELYHDIQLEEVVIL